jgi:hypothetical protein
MLNVNELADTTTLTRRRAEESGVDVEAVAQAHISEALCYEVTTLIPIPGTAATSDCFTLVLPVLSTHTILQLN